MANSGVLPAARFPLPEALDATGKTLRLRRGARAIGPARWVGRGVAVAPSAIVRAQRL